MPWLSFIIWSWFLWADGKCGPDSYWADPAHFDKQRENPGTNQHNRRILGGSWWVIIRLTTVSRAHGETNVAQDEWQQLMLLNTLILLWGRLSHWQAPAGRTKGAWKGRRVTASKKTIWKMTSVISYVRFWFSTYVTWKPWLHLENICT